MLATLKRLLSASRSIGLVTPLLIGCWALSMPFLWIYARFFPRKASRIVFWTNEGFRVAPSRLRSYGFCQAVVREGADASVLSFWDDLTHYTGLPPFEIPLYQRTLLLFRAMMAVVHGRAGVLVAQRPYYEFIPLFCLKVFYPRGLRIWTDVDDWIFDYALHKAISFRDTLPIHTAISEGCIVSSLHLEQEMRRYFSRVEIIPTFPEASLFQPSTDGGSDHGRVIFAWTGTFFMEINVRDVLFIVQALAALNDPRIVLQLVGTGEFFDETRERAQALAGALNVEFLGWREPHTMPDYYKGIDVGLYTLTTDDDFSRSKSPTKLFEYMACGKPTVVTNFGEAPRFIEHGVTGFIANDVDEFAKYAAVLVNDATLRQTMGRNARTKIETSYNANAAVERLAQVLNLPA